MRAAVPSHGGRGGLGGDVNHRFTKRRPIGFWESQRSPSFHHKVTPVLYDSSTEAVAAEAAPGGTSPGESKVGPKVNLFQPHGEPR